MKVEFHPYLKAGQRVEFEEGFMECRTPVCLRRREYRIVSLFRLSLPSELFPNEVNANVECVTCWTHYTVNILTPENITVLAEDEYSQIHSESGNI